MVIERVDSFDIWIDCWRFILSSLWFFFFFLESMTGHNNSQQQVIMLHIILWAELALSDLHHRMFIHFK